MFFTRSIFLFTLHVALVAALGRLTVANRCSRDMYVWSVDGQVSMKQCTPNTQALAERQLGEQQGCKNQRSKQVYRAHKNILQWLRGYHQVRLAVIGSVFLLLPVSEN